MPQDKARSSVNGPSLNKGCNAGLGYFRAPHRVAASSTGLSRFRLVSIASGLTHLNTVQQQKDRLPGGLLPGRPGRQ
jgi:hypothetical protein